MTTLAPTRTRTPSDFAPLVARVRAAGLLDRRRGHYAVAIAVNMLACAALCAGIVLLGDSWWQLALAVLAAVLSVQSGFLGHDAGHQQIARTRRVNRALGLLHADLLLGMSYGWWTNKHNRHHANPNHEDKDPDVSPGAFAWSPRQAAGRTGRTAQWLTRKQHLLFFPLLLLEGLNLKVGSWQTLPQRTRKDRWQESPLLIAHLAGYLALVFLSMPFAIGLTFVVVHQALFGLYLGSAFAPNHKGMPMPGPDDHWDHLRKQVLTSRNVRGGVLTDWMLGALNYQVEHHLFPSMPRPNLRRAQPIVREYCTEMGLPYTETGLTESYAIGLRHLRDVGA
ncbi:MAG TPA: acyl-CoA desaturase [Nocardioidaceae bacterium]|nr:acyl-CoA desaturase [Nocardioidaceae bacterium]